MRFYSFLLLHCCIYIFLPSVGVLRISYRDEELSASHSDSRRSWGRVCMCLVWYHSLTIAADNRCALILLFFSIAFVMVAPLLQAFHIVSCSTWDTVDWDPVFALSARPRAIHFSCIYLISTSFPKLHCLKDYCSNWTLDFKTCCMTSFGMSQWLLWSAKHQATCLQLHTSPRTPEVLSHPHSFFGHSGILSSYMLSFTHTHCGR